MIKKLVCGILLCLAWSNVNSEMGSVNDYPGVEESTTTKPKSRFYSQAASDYFNWPLEKFELMENQGFGRTEMVVMTLLSQKSTTTWDHLIKERQKGTPLRDLAQSQGLDYFSVFQQAMKLKLEIESKIPTTSTTTFSTQKE